jgi:FkbM family methyltransferase
MGGRRRNNAPAGTQILGNTIAMASAMAEWQRACVYTCLTGRYENLNEQPMAAQSAIPFLCLTDEATLQSSTWRVVKVDPVFAMDPVRSQRVLKLLPHRFLPDFDVSIYIDNSVVLTRKPEDILDRYLASSDFALPTHSFRSRLIEEFLEIAKFGLDDPLRISEQLNHYMSSDPAALDERPYWSGIQFRRHRAHNVQHALETWAAHVQRYSRRDQLSANVAFRQSGLTPQRIEINNFGSWFHIWPSISGRDVGRRGLPPERRVTFTAESLRELKVEIAPQQGTAVLNKKFDGRKWSLRWRLASPLRLIRRRWPKLANSALALARRAARHGGTDGSFASSASSVKCANGRTIYVDTDDKRGHALVRSGGNFCPNSLAMWRLLLSEGGWTHVIDVGANYGEMLVGVEVPHTAAVMALEPNPFIVPHLRRSLQEAGLKVELIAKAASARSGTAALSIDRDWSGLSSVAGVQPESVGHAIETAEVPTITLASLLKERTDARPVRLLAKIDVEGHEVAVLQGLEDTLAELEEFAALVEIFHMSVPDLEWMLARFGVELFNTETALLVKIDATTATEVQNLLADKKFYSQDAVLRRLRRA